MAKPGYPLGPRFAGPQQGLTRGSAPSTPDRSALRTGFADHRPPPCRSRRLPWSARWGGSASPCGARFRLRAWPLRSSAALMAALMAFPRGIAGEGATRRREGAVCTSAPSQMPARGIEAPGLLPSTARRPGSASAIRQLWRNGKAVSDMRNRRYAHRKIGFRAHGPRCPMRTARSSRRDADGHRKPTRGSRARPRSGDSSEKAAR